jgi:hypothetical protein
MTVQQGSSGRDLPPPAWAPPGIDLTGVADDPFAARHPLARRMLAGCRRVLRAAVRHLLRGLILSGTASTGIDPALALYLHRSGGPGDPAAAPPSLDPNRRWLT